MVDGCDVSPENLNFDLHFDKERQRYIAFELKERNEFLEHLATACSKYNSAAPPAFENVSSRVKKNLPTASGEHHRRRSFLALL